MAENENAENRRGGRNERAENRESFWSFIAARINGNGVFIMMKQLSVVIEICSIVILLVLGVWFSGILLYNARLPVSKQLQFGYSTWIERNDTNSDDTSGSENDTAIATIQIPEQYQNENQIKMRIIDSNQINTTEISDNDVFIGMPKLSLRVVQVQEKVKNKTKNLGSYTTAFAPISKLGFFILVSANFTMFLEGFARLFSLLDFWSECPINEEDGWYGWYIGRWIVLWWACILANVMMNRVNKILRRDSQDSLFLRDFAFKNDHYGFQYLCLISNIFFNYDGDLLQFSCMIMIIADLCSFHGAQGRNDDN